MHTLAYNLEGPGEIFVAVAWILGDGLFNLVRLTIITVASLIRGPQRAQDLPLTNAGGQHVHGHATERTAGTDHDEARLKNSIAAAGHEAGVYLGPCMVAQGMKVW